jgi:hypothetical protein
MFFPDLQLKELEITATGSAYAQMMDIIKESGRTNVNSRNIYCYSYGAFSQADKKQVKLRETQIQGT